MHQVEIGSGKPAAVLGAVLRGGFQAVAMRWSGDVEMARLAVDAAATRLIIVAVGAQDAIGAIDAALMLGGSGAVVADVLRISVAQRMLPRLCPTCRRSRELTVDEQTALRGTTLVDQPLFEPVGCDACQQTGYAGHQPLYWALEPRPWLTDLLRRRAPVGQLRQAAVREGEGGAFQAAHDLARQGVIAASTLIELRREELQA